MSSKTIQTLTIFNDLMSLNEYRNTNYHYLNKLKKEWTKIVKLSSLQNNIKPVNKCDITFYFHFSDKRRRDPDNYSATIKFIMDGLVTAKVLSDDNFNYVESITIKRGAIQNESVTIQIEGDIID
jgi:Holliday junction resolvase RusA-like endonuclease